VGGPWPCSALLGGGPVPFSWGCGVGVNEKAAATQGIRFNPVVAAARGGFEEISKEGECWSEIGKGKIHYR